MDRVIIAYLAQCVSPAHVDLITKGMTIAQDINDSMVEMDIKDLICDEFDEEYHEKTEAILIYLMGLLQNYLRKDGIHLNEKLLTTGHLQLLYDIYDYNQLFTESEQLDDILSALDNGENAEDAFLNVLELFSADVAMECHELLCYVSPDYLDTLRSRLADKKELINEPLTASEPLPEDYSDRIARVMNAFPQEVSLVAEAVQSGFDLYRDPIQVASIFSKVLVTVDTDKGVAMELGFILALSNTPPFATVPMKELTREVFDSAGIEESRWLEVNYHLRNAIGVAA